jgi:hypothetical protein
MRLTGVVPLTKLNLTCLSSDSAPSLAELPSLETWFHHSMLDMQCPVDLKSDGEALVYLSLVCRLKIWFGGQEWWNGIGLVQSAWLYKCAFDAHSLPDQSPGAPLQRHKRGPVAMEE